MSINRAIVARLSIKWRAAKKLRPKEEKIKNNDIESDYRSETKPVANRNEVKLRTLSTF